MIADAVKTAPAQPYPGLRPFLQSEAALFFGRAQDINRMVGCLEEKRFLAVVGGSGSGKSSLVRAGLLPVLEQGYLLGAGTEWRFVIMRPGGDPFGNLAAEFHRSIGGGEEPDPGDIAFTQAALQTSPRAFLEVLEEASLDQGAPLLLLVDQFEEIFRFRRRPAAGEGARSVHAERNDATAFVNLLLTTAEAATQADLPIYVVLTMRSDFIGDCDVFPGLPQAVSDSQFLVPRLSRRQMQEVIEKPLLLLDWQAAPDLVNQMLNAAGTDPDQLPLMQHALMRTWVAAQARLRGQDAEKVLLLGDYEKVGRFSDALCQHLEEAWATLADARQQRIAQQLFICLSERSGTGAMIRRMVKLSDVAAVANAEPGEVMKVVRVFQEEGRNFIMESPPGALSPESVLDISHEALLRQWRRLGDWLEIEARSVEMYRRLAETSARYAARQASLLRDPDLQLALDWREKEKPTAAWAGLYQGGFEPAMRFLEKSKRARDLQLTEEKVARRLRIVGNVILALLLTSLLFGPFALTKLKIVREHVSITDQLPDKLDSPAGKEMGVTVVAIPPANFKSLQSAVDSLRAKALDVSHGATPETERDKEKEQDQEKKGIEKTFSTWTSELKQDQNREALKAALAVNHLVLPQSVYANEKVRKEDKDVLKERDDLILSRRKTFSPPRTRYIVALPDSVDVVSSEQPSVVVTAALKFSSLRNRLTSNLEHGDEILVAATLFLHLLAYFALAFGVGAIYRRFGLRTGARAADPAAGQKAWQRWRRFLMQASELLRRLQSRRWKVFFAIVLLLSAVALFGYWGSETAAAPGSLLLGVILLLLAPVGALLQRSWPPRVKVAQGILLQLGGYYAFASAFCRFMDDADGSAGVAGLGLVLVILGKLKCSLRDEEMLARHPHRAPIVYLPLLEEGQATWGARMSRFFRPGEEQLLRPIFRALGPFVALGREEQSPLGAAGAVGSGEERQQRERQLMRRSALVILHVGERLTDRFRSQLRSVLPALNPEQVLVYFSHTLDAGQLRVAYQNFVEATRDALPCALPPSLDAQHFLAFEQGWQPSLCGALTKPKPSWRKVLPLSGSRLEVGRMRRAILRSLQPFFERRNYLKGQTKLFSDGAIGVAAFSLFGFGIPAGAMIFRNFWSMGRRRAAALGLVAPVVGSIAALTVAMIAAFSDHGALMLLVSFGLPCATYWLWRRLSGREMQFHVALGGPLQSRWKSLLFLVSVPLVSCTAWYSFVTFEERAERAGRAISQALEEGRHLALQGEVEAAVAAFRKAQELQPEIDLDPATPEIEKDPQVLAEKLAALEAPARKHREGKELARKGESEKAFQAYSVAGLDGSLAPSVEFWNEMGWYVSLAGNAAEGLKAVEKALTLSPTEFQRAECRDTRGLARALTGNTAGAIEDFEAFVGSGQWPSLKTEREGWIQALRSGQQPFTPQLLETMRSQ